MTTKKTTTTTKKTDGRGKTRVNGEWVSRKKRSAADQLAADLALGKVIAEKDSLGEIIPESVVAQETATPTVNLSKLRTKKLKIALKNTNLIPAVADAYRAELEKRESASKPAPATKSAATKSAPKKRAAKNDGELGVHLYGAGKVFLFSKAVAERIGGATNFAVEIKGKTLTLTPTKSTKGTSPITSHQGRSILRAGRLLGDVEWSGKTQDIIARPVGDHAFALTLDAK